MHSETPNLSIVSSLNQEVVGPPTLDIGQERQEVDGLLQGYTVNQDSLVFRYRDGSPLLPRAVSGAFKKLVHRAGLQGYRFHDTRHAHATLMLRLGVHPKVVQELLWHSQISVMLDTYSHILPDMQKDAIHQTITGQILKGP
mgnify:CR=1 FL=1